MYKKNFSSKGKIHYKYYKKCSQKQVLFTISVLFVFIIYVISKNTLEKSN